MSVIVHDEPMAEEKPLTGYERFYTVAKGVTLVRFAGKETIHLAARRKGTDGNVNALFIIDIDKTNRTAEVRKDGITLFSIYGDDISVSYLEKIAVSGLHRWCKEAHRRSATERKRRKREAAAAMEAEFHTPPQSIVEGGGECYDPECGSGAVFCNPPMTNMEVK